MKSEQLQYYKLHWSSETFSLIVTKHKYILNDDVFGFPWSEKRGEFYSLQINPIMRPYENVNNSPIIFERMSLEQSNTVVIHERKVETILDAISNIGGIFEIFIILPALLIAGIEGRMTTRKILNNINRLEKENESESTVCRLDIEANESEHEGGENSKSYELDNERNNESLKSEPKQILSFFENHLSEFDRGSSYWMKRIRNNEFYDQI